MLRVCRGLWKNKGKAGQSANAQRKKYELVKRGGVLYVVYFCLSDFQKVRQDLCT